MNQQEIKKRRLKRLIIKINKRKIFLREKFFYYRWFTDVEYDIIQDEILQLLYIEADFLAKKLYTGRYN